jgi:hypothetical protein
LGKDVNQVWVNKLSDLNPWHQAWLEQKPKKEKPVKIKSHGTAEDI